MYKDVTPKYGSIGIFTSIQESKTPEWIDSNIVIVNSGLSSYSLQDRRQAIKIDVDNDTLCFFGAILSCPSARDMYTLGSEGFHTGILPTGRNIIRTLNSGVVYNNVTGQPTKISQIPTSWQLSHDKPKHLAIAPHHAVLHADGGSSMSLIRKSIAIQLGTPLIELDEPVLVRDINKGLMPHTTVCYLQIELPSLPEFRAVVLCLVKEDCHIPFLLGNNDQKAYHIIPQADSGTIRIGPQEAVLGHLNFLAPDRWQSVMKRDLTPLTKQELETMNKDLKRQLDIGKIYANVESIIEVISHSGKVKDSRGSVHKGTGRTTISTEELKQAANSVTTVDSIRNKAAKSLQHQTQLLEEPAVSRIVDHARKLDRLREKPSVQALAQAKKEQSTSDGEVNRLQRAAMKDAVHVFTGQTVTNKTMPNIIMPDEMDYIQEFHERMHECIGATHEWDPEVTPEQLRGTTEVSPIHVCSGGTMYCKGQECDTVKPVESEETPEQHSIHTLVMAAYIAAVMPTHDDPGEEVIRETYTDEQISKIQAALEADQLFQAPPPTDNWFNSQTEHRVRRNDKELQESLLPAAKYEREIVYLSASQVKASKVPAKPTKETPEDMERTINEQDFLDPHWVPLPHIAELNDTLYTTEVLKKLQQVETAAIRADPARKETLEKEIVQIKQRHCHRAREELRPPDFPTELWAYVYDDQKPLVAARFALFTPEIRQDLIKELTDKLDIGEKFGEEARTLMRAQALANIDCFGYQDPTSPPTVPGYTFRIRTVHDRPIYQSPQKFNQLETAFLDARVHELRGVGKIEPAPDSQHNCRVCLVPYSDRIKDTIAEWQAAGLNPVEEMFKPANYKKVVLWYRLTNNLKAVNEVTIPYRYPMPDSEDPKHHTHGSKYWSVTDIKDAFFCVNLHPEDRDKTAFTTPRGRFRFTVMPQGAMNSPTFFSHVADETFQHIPKSELLNFIDDTTNHSRTFIQHMITQQAMYDALRSKRLIMKISKSHFLHDSTRCLGNIFSEFGYTPDPTHIKAIMDMAPPTDQTGVKSFLGLLNFNRNYIPKFAEITGPLNDLLMKNTEGEPTDVAKIWRDDYEGEHFRMCKAALTSAPCLLTIDSSKPFTLHVDSCKNGRGPGAVLLQQNEQGDWRPVSYFSCRLRKGEQAWSATELEAMGLVYAIRHWSPYLKIQKFTAIVDHHALIWLVTRPAKTANGRILHWISDLQEYYFDIIHRAGTLHLDADAISRLLHFSDIPHRYEDASDQVAPVNGPVTQEMLQEAYEHNKIYHDYYKYLTSKTFLEVNGPPATLPKAMPTKKPGAIQGKPKAVTTAINPEDYLDVEEDGELPPYELPDIDAEAARILSDLKQTAQYVSTGLIHEDHSLQTPVWEPHQEAVRIYLQTELQEIYSMSGLMPNEIELLFPELEPLLVSLGQQGAEGQRAPDLDNLPNLNDPQHTLLLRDKYLAPAPRKRGRPSKKDKDRVIPEPAGPSINDKRMNVTTDHREANKYKHLEHGIFVALDNKRIYKCILIAYDRHQGVIGYRRCLDDDPPDPNDDKPWKVKGNGGLEELIKHYKDNHDETYYANQAEPIKWPTTELEMRTLQRNDPALQPLIDRLQQTPGAYIQTTNTKAFYIPVNQDSNETNLGALRVMDARNPIPKSTDRVVLPISLRKQLLQYYHDEQGHPGRERSINTIRIQYWWSGMREDIETYVNSCQYCQHRKPNLHSGPVPIQLTPTPTYPFEISHLDLTGANLPKTKNGNQYILVLKDSLTRAVEIVAIPDKSEITIARVLVEKIYCRHGAPGTIITDRGTEFVNELLKQVCILLNIGRVSTSGYNPRSNGLVEQHNSTLKAMLAAYANKYQDDWDLHLPHIQYAYMTTVCTATGMTPFSMLYGREARQLCNGWIEQYFHKNTSPKAYVVQLGNALELGWQLAGLKKPMQHADWTKATKARLPFREFQVGSRFFLKHTPLYMAIKEKTLTKDPSTALTPGVKAATTCGKTISRALQHRWTGPYKITAKFSPVLYETIINGTPRVIHALHMKHDPISDALRLKQPVTISESKPMRSFLDKEHISLTLNTATDEATAPEATRPKVHFEDTEVSNYNDDDWDNESESDTEDEED